MQILVILSSILSILIGLTTLTGWLSGNMLMASVLPNTIPMAPSTALFFIAIGCLQLILLSPRRAHKVRSLTFVVSNIIFFYSLIIFVESLAMETRHLEDFIFRMPNSK